MAADVLLAWLLTYLVHGTLLLGCAWLATALWKRMPVALQEGLWRTALFGGLATASLQLALDWEPVAGRVEMPTHAARAASDAPVPTPLAADDGAVLVEASEVMGVEATPEPATTDVAATAGGTPPLDPLRVLACLWALGLLLGCARHVRARRRLHARLAGRQPVGASALQARLDALRSAAGIRQPVRLSELPGLGSPLAFGIRRQEIVVPLRATHELTAGQQDALLAHELAHHARRDALWQAAARAVAGIFFFQPLHWLAAKRLRDTAELLADAWAVERTGCRRSLAECLTVVAGWVVGAPQAEPASAMAAEGSMLERRVTRLVAEDGTPQRAPLRRTLGLLAALPLVAVALTAPAVAAGRTAPAATPPLEARPAPAASTAEALTLLDRELRALATELDEMRALVSEIPDPPVALRAGVARLAARLTVLTRHRDALRAVARPMKEPR